MLHIIPSNELSKRWRVDIRAGQDLSAIHPALVWRVQEWRFWRWHRALLCTNETSLYSCIRVASGPFKREQAETAIRELVQGALTHYLAAPELIQEAGGDIVWVKHLNRRVLGVMLDQRTNYNGHLEEENFVGGLDPEAERSMGAKVNSAPYPLLDWDSPLAAFPAILEKNSQQSGDAGSE